ncbi:unnamed protein product [Brachionus calyciflorus]|uniref:Cystatin domain-containing protein n=1 Tax=Brachionus calyciflorus TaxID=104777 RepID=A0A814A307_9BILA|nr:unnamed protein product [Brachionus calyciflorus]
MEVENRVLGGTSEVKSPDESVQAVVDKVSHHIKQHTGKDHPHFKVVSYKTQVVAGTNYFVKVDAGDEHLHLRIYEKLPCYGGDIELHGVQASKSKEDPINYF